MTSAGLLPESDRMGKKLFNCDWYRPIPAITPHAFFLTRLPIHLRHLRFPSDSVGSQPLRNSQLARLITGVLEKLFFAIAGVLHYTAWLAERHISRGLSIKLCW